MSAKVSPLPIIWNDDVADLEKIGADATWFRRDLEPGTSAWRKDAEGFVSSFLFVCPCGCGEVTNIPVAGREAPRIWSWDGNQSAPSIRPSIKKKTGCEWHGYVTKGQFITCL